MDRLFKLLKSDPLFEFLAIGLLLYGGYTLLNPTQQTPTTLKKTVIVPKTIIQNSFLDQNNSYQIEKFKKVLLEESYFLELYKQDPTISSILLQKEQYLLQNAQKIKEPTQKELLTYYKQHKKDYLPAKDFSFYMITIPKNEQTITNYLNLLSLIPQKKQIFKQYSYEQIKDFCGNYVAHTIKFSPLKRWSKPLICHNKLVSFYLFDKTPKILEDNFEEVENRIYNDYIQYQKEKILSNEYHKLLRHYEVKVQ